MSPSSLPLAGLIVLDGWGLNPRAEGNAVLMARTPVMDALTRECPVKGLDNLTPNRALPSFGLNEDLFLIPSGQAR